MSFLENEKSVWGCTLIGIVLICLGVAVKPIMYVTALFSVFVILAAPKKFVIMILFAWLSFSTVFKFGDGSTSIFTYLEFLFAVRLLVGNYRVSALFSFCWVLFAFYLFFGIGSGYTIYLKIVLIPLLFYLMAREVEHSDLFMIIKLYILGTVISSFVGYFKAFIPNMSTFVDDKSVNLAHGITSVSASRFSGLWGDPNYYSIHLVLAIVLATILYTNKEIKAVTFYFIFGICTIFGALTGSKLFIFTLVIAVIYIIYSLWGNKNYKQLIFFFTVMAAGLFLIFSGYIDAFSTIMARLSSMDLSSTNSITTGRTLKWDVYWNAISESLVKLFFGNGIGNGFSYEDPPHNFYIDCLDLLGVVGTLIYFNSIFQAAVCGWDIHKQQRGKIAPLLITLLMFTSLSMFFSIDLLFELFITSAVFVLVPQTEVSLSSEAPSALTGQRRFVRRSG